METSPLFCILILLAHANAAVEKGKCDPLKEECKGNEYCQDHDADGEWTCACLEGYEDDDNGFCVLNACPFEDDDNGKYRTISGKCYYFSKESLSFVNASANCKNKFNGAGRLFEPMSEQSITVVQAAQKNFPSTTFWIGIRIQQHSDTHTKDDFYYLSKGPFTPLSHDGWEVAEPNNVDKNEGCVGVLNHNKLGWSDLVCNDQNSFICELDNDDSCMKPEYANDFYCDDENNNAACNWDGGACCNYFAYPDFKWDKYCKKCKCLDPHARVEEIEEKCEDLESAKKCKKDCGKKKCKDDFCTKNCKKTCKLCNE